MRRLSSAFRVKALINSFACMQFAQQKDILHYDIEGRADNPGHAAFELIHQVRWPALKPSSLQGLNQCMHAGCVPWAEHGGEPPANP